ncbi:HGxxPAAW family protein [Streptomyces sp. NPDC058371]|uniref:HGxxPAAW family protein n=1 Tax=Streptomyces sp. NPDC058371 TaxID=3346463 RepID=UPI00365BDB36
MSGHQYDEGHTVAGWVGTAVAAAGTAVTGVGMCGWRPGIALGLGVMASAVLVTWVLHLAGWGKPSGPRPVDQWSLRVRDRSARAGHAGCFGCRLAGRRGVPRPASDSSQPVVPAPEAGLPAEVSS